MMMREGAERDLDAPVEKQAIVAAAFAPGAAVSDVRGRRTSARA